MVTAANPLEVLLADLQAADVRLSLRGVRIVAVAPAGAVTPALAARIRQHRAEIAHALRLSQPCGPCGSAEVVDTSIHGGKSTRRDCARCGHTLGFPRWHGQSCPPITTPPAESELEAHES